MNQRLVVADALAVCVARLGAVLMPWGFSFQSGDVDQSHNGPFASGYYVRDATRIGLSCRDTIDNLDYEHSFVTVHAFSRESEHFRIGRATLMRAAGHADDCWLIECKEIPDVIKARNGSDRVAALIHDLRFFAEPLLREPSNEFYAAVRRGARSYSIDSSGAG
jgi:hypothetical protein